MLKDPRARLFRSSLMQATMQAVAPCLESKEAFQASMTVLFDVHVGGSEVRLLSSRIVLNAGESLPQGPFECLSMAISGNVAVETNVFRRFPEFSGEVPIKLNLGSRR
jgi:hypothetical protein